MTRKKKRSKKQQDINWSQGMASFGDIYATLGLIFAWLMMFGCIGFGIYVIVKGAQGKPMTSFDGMCQDSDLQYENSQCMDHITEESCNAAAAYCQWNSDGESKLSDAGKAGYIVGGVFTILFGIGIVMLANWIRNKTRTDRNFAAVFGTGALAEGIASAFGGR